MKLNPLPLPYTKDFGNIFECEKWIKWKFLLKNAISSPATFPSLPKEFRVGNFRTVLHWSLSLYLIRVCVCNSDCILLQPSTFCLISSWIVLSGNRRSNENAGSSFEKCRWGTLSSLFLNWFWNSAIFEYVAVRITIRSSMYYPPKIPTWQAYFFSKLGFIRLQSASLRHGLFETHKWGQSLPACRISSESEAFFPVSFRKLRPTFRRSSSTICTPQRTRAPRSAELSWDPLRTSSERSFSLHV